MITARIKDKKYQIPTSWNEVTFGQYVKLSQTKDSQEMLSIITGIPLDIIKKTDNFQLHKLSIVLGFLQVKLDHKLFKVPESFKIGDKVIPFVKDICEKTFGQKIYFHEVMKQERGLVDLSPEIVAIYLQPYFDGPKFDLDKLEKIIPLLNDVFFVDLYAAATNYIEQLKQILINEEKTLSTKPDPEQELAGIQMFDQFGVMNTVKALANNDVTKYAEVLEIEYNTVFVHMRMNKVQNDFNENYRKVMDQKRKSK